MAGSKSSKRSRHSDRGGLAAAVLCFLICGVVMSVAVWWFYRTGAILYSGDAEAHLNIARRVIDSRTPGWDQLGTAWLPLPHLLMVPFVRNDWMWQTGLAGSAVSAVCTALASAFLFASMRRIFESSLAGASAVAVYVLNPNTLYLGSIPMTEPVLFASVFALLYFTVCFGETPTWWAALGAGVAACAGTLTRYEAWFLLPFVAVYIFLRGGQQRRLSSIVFCAVAGAGPVLWLAHNWWYFRDALYFYRGPWSAVAIQGNAPYPGKGNWVIAAQYYLAAGRLIAGISGLAVAAAGLLVALWRRAFWPVFFLILQPAFYVWSIHSSATPIHVPDLWPHSWYNIRYAMAFLPLVALGVAAIATFGRMAAAAAVLVGMALFLLFPTAHPITWQEAEINSRGRRDWTGQAVKFLRSAAGPHETFFTSFNDITAIYRTLGVPLRDTLTGDISPQYLMASSRPDLFLWEDWAVVMGGDQVQSVIDNARLRGPRYQLSDRIIVKGQPVIEIYHRTDDIPLR